MGCKECFSYTVTRTGHYIETTYTEVIPTGNPVKQGRSWLFIDGGAYCKLLTII